MLGRTSYSIDYITGVQARVTRTLKAFDKAKPAEPFASEALLDVILGLEMAFVHRVRMNEGKDGNPLNEVRMIAASVLEFGGLMTLDKTIKWNADTSVTGLEIGDRIALSRKQVGELVDAFFEEIAKKYS
jgi:hypothetical protein